MAFRTAARTAAVQDCWWQRTIRKAFRYRNPPRNHFRRADTDPWLSLEFSVIDAGVLALRQTSIWHPPLAYLGWE